MHAEAVNILTKALQKEKGWINVVVLAEEPNFFNLITVNQAVKIQRKLNLLKHAVCLAYDKPERKLVGILDDLQS
jgi:hypothetical protein